MRCQSNSTQFIRASSTFQDLIAQKEGVSRKAAGAILGSRTRKASVAAKRRNPALNKVK